MLRYCPVCKVGLLLEKSEAVEGEVLTTAPRASYLTSSPQVKEQACRRQVKKM